MSDPKIPGAVLLGPGKSRKYWRREIEGRLLEHGGETWLLPEGYFCECCEGSGCTACKWTGEEAKRQEILKFKVRPRVKSPTLAAASSDGGGSSPAPPTGDHNPDT